MKLPVAFGNKLFFRVVLPGSVLTSSLMPLTISVFKPLNDSPTIAATFVIQTLILGWIVVSLDRPIYMLFEGRRFWPSPLFRLFCRLERSRLLRLHKVMRRCRDAMADRSISKVRKIDLTRRRLEAAVDLSQFPLDRTTSFPAAEWPTRLGNLIAEYEQYPRLKYGLDAVFFWPRLWVSIDQNLRDEIDNQQAQADGLLYASFSFAAAAPISASYSMIQVDLPATSIWHTIFGYPFSTAIACITLCILVYRGSLYTHAFFGDTFKATFDQYRDRLKLNDVLDIVENLACDPRLAGEIDIVRNVAVWRLLRWHRVRLPGKKRNQRVRLP